TLGGESLRHGLTDAASTAGHEDPATFESARHPGGLGPGFVVQSGHSRTPASTGSATPVMNRASSEARNNTALLMSSGATQPMPIGLRSFERSHRSSGPGFSRSGPKIRKVASLCSIGVSTALGLTVLTRMPW